MTDGVKTLEDNTGNWKPVQYLIAPTHLWIHRCAPGHSLWCWWWGGTSRAPPSGWSPVGGCGPWGHPPKSCQDKRIVYDENDLKMSGTIGRAIKLTQERENEVCGIRTKRFFILQMNTNERKGFSDVKIKLKSCGFWKDLQREKDSLPKKGKKGSKGC